MAGHSKVDAHEILKRIKRLKSHIDKGKETSIHRAVKKYIRSSHFSRSLLKRHIVHVNKDKTLRWNGLAVNLTLAQEILDDAHNTHKAYLDNFKNKKSGKRKYTKRKAPAPVNLASDIIVDSSVESVVPQGQQQPPLVDVNTVLDRKTLERMASILGVGDNSDMEELRASINGIREDMVRIKAFLFDIHMDHKERMIESITQQMGAQT